MERKYTVYKHTSPEGKVYIGCTSINPKRRWGKRYPHNDMFSNDIEKFGWGNFKHEIIASRLTEDEAYDMEKELIHKYNTTDPSVGYNRSTGGRNSRGFHLNEEFKQKLREINTGKHHSEETRRKIREANTGRSHTKETKRKLSEMRFGENNPMYGKHPSEETRRKIGDARRGFHHTDEAKRKISEATSRKVMCIETGIIYESMQKAAQHTGATSNHIPSVCRGKRNTSGGYHWKYVD